MRGLALLLATCLLAIAGCGDDCPSSSARGQSCSSIGMSCVVEDAFHCVCIGELWECSLIEDGGNYPPVHDLAVRDLSVRDLSPATD
jgi:hypothetical protein